MKGVAWQELFKAVGEGIDSADEDLAREILRLVAEAAKVPWHNQTTKEKYLDDKGEEIPTPHFFVIWLWGLAEGSWRLPPHYHVKSFKDFADPTAWYCFAVRTAWPLLATPAYTRNVRYATALGYPARIWPARLGILPGFIRLVPVFAMARG